MAQLYFNYSTMDSGKSLDLLKSAYNYESQGKKVLLFTSHVDTRNGEIAPDSLTGTISTRLGVKKEAWLIERVNVFQMAKEEMPDCIFVDEAQFIEERFIVALSDIVDYLNIPVICYGLKTDSNNDFFVGSAALLKYANKLQELKTVCLYCNNKATMNMRTEDDVPVFDAAQICIDGDENSKKRKIRYVPVCRKCYKKAKKKFRAKKFRKEIIADMRGKAYAG